MGRYINAGIGNGTSGQPQGSLGQNAYSEKMRHLNKLPANEAQLKHIFCNRLGHLPDTPQNRHIVTAVANDDKNLMGQDCYGNEWYAKILPDGSQIWVKVYNEIISNAGQNNPPREWDNETGYANNPRKNNTWRKRK